MNKVTTDKIQELIDYDGGEVISIYIPTHRHSSPPHMQEDQTRFKNNLKQAVDDWSRRGNDVKLIAGSVESLESLADDLSFWQNTTESLAIFINSDEFILFHLPIECEEQVWIADKYNVVPLLAVDNLNADYYVLALAMHQPKLLKGDLYGLSELDLALPKSPEDALNIDELHANSKTSRSHQGGGASSPHGEGDSSEAGNQERIQYFRLIEEAILTSDDYSVQAPILLTGTDGEVGDFRAGTRLQGLIQGWYIAGNHTETSTQDLHKLAKKLIHSACVEPEWTEMLEQLGNMSGTGKSSININEITEAAELGRVESLIVPIFDVTRDSISDVSGGDSTMIIRRLDSKSIKGIIEAVTYVARQSGQVYCIETDEYLPDGTKLAAIYRY